MHIQRIVIIPASLAGIAASLLPWLSFDFFPAVKGFDGVGLTAVVEATIFSFTTATAFWSVMFSFSEVFTASGCGLTLFSTTVFP